MCLRRLRLCDDDVGFGSMQISSCWGLSLEFEVGDRLWANLIWTNGHDLCDHDPRGRLRHVRKRRHILGGRTWGTR